MKLITEINFHDVAASRVDESTGSKQWFIEGVFAQAEKRNRNGRTYPVSVLEREVNRYDKEYVKTNRALGELNHPAYPQLNPENACHRIVEMWKDGNNFMGKAMVLNTPKGQILQGLLEGGTQMGVSTRGLGSIKESVVQDDFHLTCVDSVADPSGIDCFTQGILEGVEWIWEGDKLKEVAADQALKDIKKMQKVDEEKLLQVFNKFMGSI